MNAMTWVLKKLKIRDGNTEAKKIVAETQLESRRTSKKIDQANRVLKQHITITHNIGIAMGVLR